MSTVRIQGLVRLMNNVRHQLAEGIDPSQVKSFRSQVEESLAHIESICRKYRIKPENLPAPSYRAYCFLKNVDLQNLPLRIHRKPSAVHSQLRVSNLNKACDDLHMRMTELVKSMNLESGHLNPDSPQVKELQAAIRRLSNSVEKRCLKKNHTPGDLPLRSRRAYQWLRLLCDAGNLLLHLDTLAMSYRIARQPENLSRFPLLRRRQTVRISIFNTSSLYRARQQPHSYDIVLHEGFISAPPDVIEALLYSALLGRTSQRSAIIRRYAAGDEFGEIAITMALSDGGSKLSSRGQYYDLEDVFKRVNQQYFSGKLERPQLSWNRTLTSRKFGHYQPDSDTVMLSLTLDSPDVPQMLVDFVMYHELLHKALGTKIIGSRQYAHTPEFRAAEKKFNRYREAQSALERLARGKASA